MCTKKYKQYLKHHNLEKISQIPNENEIANIHLNVTISIERSTSIE